jgi:hypothetical protein
MILLDHIGHLIDHVLDGPSIQSLIAERIQQPFGILHNFLANTIEYLPTPMDYHYPLVSVHMYNKLCMNKGGWMYP